MAEENQNEQLQETRGEMAWVIIAAFIIVNTVCLFTGIFTPYGAERILQLTEILFWFDLTCAGIIATYFGIDIVKALRQTNLTSK